MPIKMNSIQIREPELEEEVVALPDAEKDADVLRRASIERVLKGCVYHGTVEDIEQGKDTGERLYLIRYTDGDTEHLTADQVRQWSRTADGDASATQEPVPVAPPARNERVAKTAEGIKVAPCWHGDACPWHKRSMCFFGHSSAPPVREQTVETIKMIPQELNHFTSTLSTSSWVLLSMLWSGSWPSRHLSNRYKNGSWRWRVGAKRDSTSSKRDRPLQEVPSSQ